MPSPLCKPVSGPLKPLLDRDHLARGEPLLPFPVLPQPHQLGRRLHRAHSGIELVLAVAVPMDEHRQVAGGERRLLPRDRVQCDPRLGNDLLAIRARDPGMVLDPLGLKPLFGHPRCCRPDLVLRLKLDPLRR